MRYVWCVFITIIADVFRLISTYICKKIIEPICYFLIIFQFNLTMFKHIGERFILANLEIISFIYPCVFNAEIMPIENTFIVC